MKFLRNINFSDTYEGAESYDLMPPYSNLGIKYIYDNLFNNKKQIIADIGSGTGRLSSQILYLNTVYGVEPDSKMRKIAEKKFKNNINFFSIDGTAETTNLLDSSIDFLTIGQAFHRFNREMFRIEANRILKEPDNVIILWNRINYKNPIFNDLLLAIKKSYAGYRSRFVCDNEVEGSLLEIEENNQSASNFYYGKSKLLTFPNSFELSKEDFQKLCLSLWIFPLANGNESQEILKSTSFNVPLFQEFIDTIFEKYQSNKKIVLPLETDIHFSI